MSTIPALYPRKFGLVRLEPLGDPPYFGPDEARARYLEGRGLEVIDGGSVVPQWLLSIAPAQQRFNATFYSPTRTPIRSVRWERENDDAVLRRTIDIFYPDGDPSGRRPYADLISVSREFSTDGHSRVTLASPFDIDQVRDDRGPLDDQLRRHLPEFGAWHTLLDEQRPHDVQHFGPGAIGSARVLFDTVDAMVADDVVERTSALAGGWLVPSTAREILATVDSLIGPDPSPIRLGVFTRGRARIVPLAVQADPTNPEQSRRMTSLASDVRDACENREGQGIPFRLDVDLPGSTGSYAASLVAAGATRVTYWVYGWTMAVAIVWSGIDGHSDQTLAVHVVPASWVDPDRADAAALTDLSWDRSSLELSP